MIKILHLGKFYPPDYGGIESVTKTIIESSSNDVKHTIICFSKKGKNYKPDNENIIRCKVLFNIKNQPISIKYLFTSILRFKTADIIHVHSPNILAYIALLFCYGKKIVVHWHSDILNKGFLYRIIKPLEKLIIKKADTIIVTSEEYFRFSRPLKKYPKKVVIIPLGIEDVKERNLHIDASTFFNEFNNKDIILSIGRLVNYKGHELILRAARFFSDNIVAIIIGTGPERERILKYIRENNIKNIHIIENLNDAQRNELYQKCKIFCLSSISRQEAFGVVLLEALCFGKPLIVNEVRGSGMNWVNKNKFTGLNFNMKDSKQFGDIINSLTKDNKQLEEYSRNSRTRYDELFTDKLMITKIEQVYHQLLRSSK